MVTTRDALQDFHDTQPEAFWKLRDDVLQRTLDAFAVDPEALTEFLDAYGFEIGRAGEVSWREFREFADSLRVQS